jgi:hypothetical protein
VTTLPRVYADFNDIGMDGTILVPAAGMGNHPGYVELYDGEGNTMRGTVRSLMPAGVSQRMWAVVELDPGSWKGREL